MALILLLFVIAFSCGVANAASPLKFTAYPVVSPSPVLADGVTIYTVTTTVSDADGYNDLKTVRVMFSYTESGGDSAKGRGYMAWAVSDALITKWGGNWVIADATGGYRWGYESVAWGGTTYITPISCSTSTSGSASGGNGTRTVTWTFIANPAWALNPMVNDADCYASDATYNIGWLDNPTDFDVIASACGSYAQTPSAPVTANAGANSVDVSINPADSSSDLFCIKISPVVDLKSYIQADGTVGYAAAWLTKAQWGSKTVTGLTSSTTYSFSARAVSSAAGVCASGFGPAASTTTAMLQHSINAGVSGKEVSPHIVSAATRLDVAQSLGCTTKLWNMLYNVCPRGIAGGLDADTYNWKDMGGQGVGHTGTPGADVPTTLTWMKNVRDHNGLPLITVNCRGIGPVVSSGYSRFYYSDTNVSTVVSLAADWVRYVNTILPTYRLGDTLPASDQAVLDSINWYGRSKLLASGEAATPKVTWWEIGNEPELALPWSTPSVPTFGPSSIDYANRYQQITTAMLAVDPTLKLGPCITTANNGNAWLDAVLADSANKVDFISYHPYGPLYWTAQSNGDTAEAAESALKTVRQQQINYYNNIVARVNASGRNANDIKLIVSEWNVSDWHWELSAQAARMSHAIGSADTLFTYADLGIFAAHYWSYPTYSNGIETPGYKVFREMQQSMGDKLINSFDDDTAVRIYTTLNTRTHDLSVWMLNLSNASNIPIRLNISNLKGVIQITQKKLGKLSGTTGLLDYQLNSGATTIDWTTTDLTGTIDPPDFTVTLPSATVNVITFHQQPSSIASLKGAADGELVGVDSAIISAVFPDCFYIESDKRTAGIRVSLPGHNLNPGTRVSLSGFMGTNADGERQVVASGTHKVGAGSVTAIGVANAALGGVASRLQAGVQQGCGLNNIGLLVRVWGKVKSVDRSAGSITIDDGTGIGVKCIVPSGMFIPGWWSYVTVNGVSSCERVGDEIRRVIRVSQPGDIFVERENVAGMLAGRVTDSGEDVLQGMTVTLNPGGLKTKTTADGSYLFENVPAGTYSVTASRPGFVTKTTSGVSVDYGQVVTCNFTLSKSMWYSYLDGSLLPGNVGWRLEGSDPGLLLYLGTVNRGIKQTDNDSGYDEWNKSNTASSMTMGGRFRIDSYSGSDIDIMVFSAGGNGSTPLVSIGIMDGRLVLKGAANEHVLVDLGLVNTGGWNTAFIYIDNASDTVALEWNGEQLFNAQVTDLYSAGGTGYAEFGASNSWGQGGSSTVTFDWLCYGPGNLLSVP